MKNKKNVSPSSAGDISLSPKQLKELADIERKGLLTKCKIADLTGQILLAQNQQKQLFEELAKANTDYEGRVHKFAAGFGIDIDAKPEETGERYEFNGHSFIRHPFLKPSST